MDRFIGKCGPAVLVAIALAFAGCGPKRPETVPVGGRVTYAGKPVSTGRIVFQPENGRSAIASLDVDGRYALTTFEPGDGAMPGKHVVTITATRVPNNVQPSIDTQVTQPPNLLLEEVRGHQGASRAVEWLIPAKYSRSNTTPLTAEVTSGQNTIDFNLPQSK